MGLEALGGGGNFFLLGRFSREVMPNGGQKRGGTEIEINIKKGLISGSGFLAMFLDNNAPWIIP